MKKRKNQMLTVMVVGALSVLLSSCGENEGTETTSETEVSPNPVLEGAFLTEKPPEATSVLDLRKSAKAGDEVVVSGKIGGAMNPFTEGFATFVFADRTLKTCDLTIDDQCPTPWDACCADPAEIAAARISVQILDGENRPVASGLKSVRGLSELDELVITGVVAEGSSEKNMVVNATGIFLEKNWVAPKTETDD